MKPTATHNRFGSETFKHSLPARLCRELDRKLTLKHSLTFEQTKQHSSTYSNLSFHFSPIKIIQLMIRRFRVHSPGMDSKQIETLLPLFLGSFSTTTDSSLRISQFIFKLVPHSVRNIFHLFYFSQLSRNCLFLLQLILPIAYPCITKKEEKKK